MTEQKRKLIMDIMTSPPPPEPPITKRGWRRKAVWQKLSEQKRSLSVLAVVALLVITVVSAVHLLSPTKHRIADTSAFPTASLQQIHGFTFYYLKPSFQTDFTLQRSSIHYQSGVLVFQLKNPAGKILAFTEERTPAGYNVADLQSGKQFNTEYGRALVIDGTAQTSGALFSQDSTWVVVNAPQAIGGDLMRQLLENLSPTK